MDSLQTAKLCATFADDKKAEDIVVMDLRGLSPVTDFFVVCSAGSPPQLRAIRDEIVSEMWKQHKLKPLFVDGAAESQWVIVNFPNVLVHVQSVEKREYYALEELWGDAARLPWQQAQDPKPRGAKATKSSPPRKGKTAAGKSVKASGPKAASVGSSASRSPKASKAVNAGKATKASSKAGKAIPVGSKAGAARRSKV